MVMMVEVAKRSKLLFLLFQGLANLSTRILGSNTLVQGALPAILENTPKTFFDELVNTLHVSAGHCYCNRKRFEF